MKKKTFCQNRDYFCYRFIKNDIIFMHLLCIYKKTINLSLLKINRLLNFTMYILTILACSLKLRTTIFFSVRVFFHGHWRLTGQQGARGDNLLFDSITSTCSGTFSIYLQLCMWDDCHIYLIAPLVFARLPLHGIYHLIEIPFDWLMMWQMVLFVYMMIWS